MDKSLAQILTELLYNGDHYVCINTTTHQCPCHLNAVDHYLFETGPVGNHCPHTLHYTLHSHCLPLSLTRGVLTVRWTHREGACCPSVCRLKTKIAVAKDCYKNTCTARTLFHTPLACCFPNGHHGQRGSLSLCRAHSGSGRSNCREGE